jgi:TetR/AcrR family transcriptional regulator, transcriptional repressor of bet genes
VLVVGVRNPGSQMPGRKESEQERREQLLRAALEVGARGGVGGLTVRSIAAEAGVSHGLVHFHFRSKEQLVRALLDWVLAETLALSPPPEDAGSGALDRLRSLLQREMERLSSDPRRTRLFFEFWAMGTRDPGIGERISLEMERYRSELRVLTEEVLRSEVAAFRGVTPDGLAAVAVSFINGCAVQAMIDPRHFDIEEYLGAVRGMIGQLAAPEGEGPTGGRKRSTREVRAG